MTFGSEQTTTRFTRRTQNDRGASTPLVLAASVFINLVITIGVLLVFGVIGPFSPDNNIASPLGIGSNTADNGVDENPAESMSVVEVVDQVSPAVISIVVTQDVPIIERFLEEGPSGMPLFEFRQRGTREQQIAGGSGFFVSSDGLIVTNSHVVSADEADYTAITSEGESYGLEIVGNDPFLDIALLRVEDNSSDSFPFLEFGDSDNLALGQTVIAIGNALGQFQNSVSVGVVSGLSRSIIATGQGIEPERLGPVIQTDAAINPGNSGGPLLSLSGRVVGVNVAIAAGSDNISFAIPSDSVEEIVESFEAEGEIVRPFLGVTYTHITPEAADRQDLPVENGALIVADEQGTAVVPGSAADRAGIREGDIILAVDGTEVNADGNPLGSLIREHSVGEQIALSVFRDGQRFELEARLDRAPSTLP